jgi:pimeloyl-ACP methyl ester carboxylesterase
MRAPRGRAGTFPSGGLSRLDAMTAVPNPYAEHLARASVTERTVRVLGSDTHYWEYGERRDGPTLVLVHGFRGDHHGLEPVVAFLPGVQIVSPDLPGFGASTPLQEVRHDVEGYGRWLAGFLAGIGAEDVVIVGHSFGSIVVAGAVAAGLPVERVVLINPIAAPALAGPRGVLTRLAVFYYWLSAALPERLGFALLRNRVIVRIMSLAMVKTRRPALRRFVHDQHDRHFSAFADRRVVLEAFRASVGEDVSEFAARIPEPTLLIAADRDDITPVLAEVRLQHLFPNASLKIIAGVGHLIHYEKPREAAAFIKRFLGLEGDK